MKKLYFLITLLLILPHYNFTSLLTGKCIGIIDGDTINVLQGALGARYPMSRSV
jgi:hypothetical protein